LALVPASRRGGVPEWLKGADCKSAGVRLRWFESNPLHQEPAVFRRFEPQNPQNSAIVVKAIVLDYARPCAHITLTFVGQIVDQDIDPNPQKQL
jgi:hypothetical protein